ncbi:helix-turn-helix transcriptional regulator [Xanthomonas hyacinthi]|uniref:helix-turn-helix transcriptional regulator n=1 Tax=Xanthomonas hyacinthi TaxID=56455 RepID=UPI00361AE66F
MLHRYGLEGVLDGVNNEQSVQSLFFGKFGGLTQRLTDSFDHLRRHDGSLLDLQIVALGLLSEQTRPFAKQRAVMDKVRASDQDKMLAARDIMMSQYDHPLTIAYLCTRVGTNEFKLKQGFRELFGTSPHRMLTDIRMQKAWELLETGLYVSTVAYKVGYQHLSSFSAAFERYYGRTPKSVTKSTS